MVLPKFGHLESDTERSHPGWHACLLQPSQVWGEWAALGCDGRAGWIWGGV